MTSVFTCENFEPKIKYENFGLKLKRKGLENDPKNHSYKQIKSYGIFYGILFSFSHTYSTAVPTISVNYIQKFCQTECFSLTIKWN